MKKLLLACILFTGFEISANADAAAAAATPGAAVGAAKAAPKINDPIVLEFKGKKKKVVKFSELMPILASVTGGNIVNMPKDQLLKMIMLAKKMYITQEVLTDEALAGGYDRMPQHKERIERAKTNALIDAMLIEIGKKISDAELKKAYPDFVAKRTLNEYKFNVVVVADLNTAKLVAQSAKSGVAMGKIAKDKSAHRSADRADNPGLVDFTRQDRVGQEFGMEFASALGEIRAGEVTNPIRTPDGRFAIAKLEAKRKAAPLSFKEVEPLLRSQCANKYFLSILDKKVKSGEIVFIGLDGKPEKVEMIPVAAPAKK